jgi:hypothetical protein
MVAKADESERIKLDDRGHLPEGVHELSLEAIEELFGKHQRTNKRCKLLENLRKYVKEVADAPWEAQVIVDGSFVMQRVDEPGDIDIILVMPPDWDMAAEVKPFEYNLISRKRTRSKYGFDVFPVRSGSSGERDLVDFFQQVNVKWCSRLNFPLGLRKGIVKVKK